MGRIARRLAALAVLPVTCLGLLAGPSEAGPLFTITEKDAYTDTGIYLKAGQTIQISATNDQIWAGWWFTGNNGPAGWTSNCNNASCPMPKARAYSLIVQIGGTHTYVGNRARISMAESGYVVLKINDDAPGNGSGYFKASVDVLP